jgi:hypothetical protein
MMPAVIETAVMFKKPWSKTEPDYYLEEVEEWIVFPFELGEINRLRVASGETPDESIPRRRGNPPA